MKVEIIQNGKRKLVSRRDARILVAVGRAAYAPPEVQVQKADPPADTGSDKPAKKAKRKYQRRDLRAED